MSTQLLAFSFHLNSHPFLVASLRFCSVLFRIYTCRFPSFWLCTVPVLYLPGPINSVLISSNPFQNWTCQVYSISCLVLTARFHFNTFYLTSFSTCATSGLFHIFTSTTVLIHILTQHCRSTPFHYGTDRFCSISVLFFSFPGQSFPYLDRITSYRILSFPFLLKINQYKTIPHLSFLFHFFTQRSSSIPCHVYTIQFQLLSTPLYSIQFLFGLNQYATLLLHSISLLTSSFPRHLLSCLFQVSAHQHFALPFHVYTLYRWSDPYHF